MYELDFQRMYFYMYTHIYVVTYYVSIMYFHVCINVNKYETMYVYIYNSLCMYG